MKRIILIFLVFLALACTYLICNELSYSPLTSSETGKLFKEFKGNYHKVKGKDLIGLSTHGDIYDIYLYHFDDVKAEGNFPQIDSKWEKHQVISSTLVGKWTECPLDSIALKLNKSILEPIPNNGEQWLKDFNNQLDDKNNYYSYLYFDEANQYFFLFCPISNSLFYVRKNGLY